MVKKKIEIRDKTIFDGIVAKWFLKLLFRFWFKISGWKYIKNPPEGAGITIAAPHTSNWDFIYALGAAILTDVKIYFSIKDSWCKLPLIGRFILWLGAIPIDRTTAGQGQVDQIRAFVERHKDRRVFFLFTPEGTRGAVQKWKTGFYHVAEQCGLPVFLAKVDYLLKEAGVFHSYALSGDKSEDVQSIQASYKRIYGKFPEHQFPEYVGPLPELTAKEASILKALYTFRGVATKMDIAAKAKFAGLSTKMLDFLIEKGVLELADNVNSSGQEPTYRLTFTGKGCLLHLFPTLPHDRLLAATAR